MIEARRAVAADYARRGIGVDAERIVLTASTSEAYSLLFKLLAAPGDDVLVPRPSYPLFELLTTLDGLAARPYDLEYHGIWSIDLASIERAVGPRTRALLVVNPNNPTGSFVSRVEIDRLAAICGPRGIALIVDEVFADYELDADEAADRARVLTRNDVLVFGLGGLSKSIGLPQLKLGWIAVAGPDRIVAEAIGRLELMCDTYLSVSTPVQLAAAELLDRGAAVRSQIAARVVGQLRPAEGAIRVRAFVVRPDGIRWLVRGRAGANVAIGGGAGARPRDLRRRAGASRLFLRLSARVLSDREPVVAGGALRRRRRADARTYTGSTNDYE